MKHGDWLKGITVAVCTIAALAYGSTARAQEEKPYAVSHKAKFQLQGALGFGAESHVVGTTTTGEEVKISAGGGAGLGIGAGYSFTDRFDLDVDLGVQASAMTPAVANGEGTFTRTYLLATAKYKVPVSPRTQLKFGLGAGYYLGGNMDIDTSAAAGNKLVIDYGNAAGMHGTGEMEIGFSDGMYVAFGLKYYHVTYTADTVSIDGVRAQPSVLKDAIRNLDGSGIDLMASIGKYF